jgi:hypothetical protein
MVDDGEWEEIHRLAKRSKQREKKKKRDKEIKESIEELTKSFRWNFRFFGKP